MVKKKTIIKTLRLRKDVVDKVNEMREKDNRSFTNMIETILLRAKT